MIVRGRGPASKPLEMRRKSPNHLFEMRFSDFDQVVFGTD
jgi:hypothetical protein